MPSRSGHFLLESGYHTDQWIALDLLFAAPQRLAPLVVALADLIRPHRVQAVCGPLLGGAFLAQALATALNTEFYYTAPTAGAQAAGLFSAEYQLAPGARPRVRGLGVAVVDDVISAGSSVRATAAALTAAGASIAVVATLLLLGQAAVAHFEGLGVPVLSLTRREISLWRPQECPLCRSQRPLENLSGLELGGDA